MLHGVFSIRTDTQQSASVVIWIYILFYAYKSHVLLFWTITNILHYFHYIFSSSSQTWVYGRHHRIHGQLNLEMLLEWKDIYNEPDNRGHWKQKMPTQCCPLMSKLYPKIPILHLKVYHIPNLHNLRKCMNNLDCYTYSHIVRSFGGK